MNSEYNHAMANVMQDFEGCSRSQLCSITRELGPLAKFIARKEIVMRRRSDLMGEHAKLAASAQMTAMKRSSWWMG